MKIITVIQARVGSSRLPGKALLPILGKPLLYRIVERVSAARHVGTIVVATSNEPQDDAIVEMCVMDGIQCIRGSESDLLDRHFLSANLFKADIIAKIPSDCPLIDPVIIDKVFLTFLEECGDVDFVSNLHPATYPDGNDVEVMTMQALTTAWQGATRDFEREHTTPFIWERPELFKMKNVDWETGLNYSMSHRWTIDYIEDYQFIKTVYENLYLENPAFGLNDILELLESNPEIAKINRKFAGMNWYRSHLDELKTISDEQTVLV